MKQRGVAATRYTVRVRFGETDMMGIVHHAAYLLYFEAGRVEYLRRRGVDAAAWRSLGLHFPVVEATLRYRKPATFDELLVVETELPQVSRVTLNFTYRISRGDMLIVEGNTLLACVGENYLPKRLPAEAIATLIGPEIFPREDDRA